jgi:hypothetical protein
MSNTLITNTSTINLKPNINWLTVAEIVKIGFSRSPVVMANEAHNGLLRCVRTRVVGQEIIRAAHAAGCRTLAAEALNLNTDQNFDDAEVINRTRQLPESPRGPYLKQPDMRQMLQVALDLGWTFERYEADSKETTAVTESQGDWAGTNFRERKQAENLVDILSRHEKLLVWCGNGHHHKVERNEWSPMGYQFRRISGIDPFCIDQNKTTEHYSDHKQWGPQMAERFRSELVAKGGVAGYLSEKITDAELPKNGMDAHIFALENKVE